MVETYYKCDNCGKEVLQKNARFETSTEDFKPGWSFDSQVTSYETALCTKCYDTYKSKAGRSSYGEPDIDISST